MRRINPADSLIVPGPTNEPTITMDVRLGKYFDLLDVNQEYAGTLLRAYSNATDIPPSQRLHLSADTVCRGRASTFGDYNVVDGVATVYMGSILKSVGHCARDQRRKNPWPVTLANRVTSELAGEAVAHELSHAGDFINMGEEALLQERLQYNRHEKRKSSWKLIPAASSWLGSIVAVSYAGLAVEYTDPSPMVKWGVTGLCVSGLALGAYRHLQSRVAQLPNSHKAYVNRPDEQRARTRAGAYWEARIAVPPSAPQLITALLRAKTFQSLTGTKTPQ